MTEEATATAGAAPTDLAGFTALCNEVFGTDVALDMSCQDSCAFFYLDESKIFECNIACTEAYPDDLVAEGCEPFTTKVLEKLEDLPDALGEGEEGGTPDATELPGATETEGMATETLTLLPAEEAPLGGDPEDPTVTEETEESVPTFSVSLPAEEPTTTKTTRKTIAVGRKTTRKKTTTESFDETLPTGSASTTRSVNRITLVTGSRSPVTRPDPLAGQPGGLIDQIGGGADRASPGMYVAAAAVFGLVGVAIGV